MAWLSEDQLRDLEELETRQHSDRGRKARGEASTAGHESPGGETGGSASKTEEEDEEAAAAAWMERADRAMDVWAEVLGVIVDHGNGISQEERARRSEPYGDWDGLPPPCLNYTPW
ncbi:hypothetical protein BV20DRAFT_960786 [Pilatotrama ljubarskyi]|nr:hypothetical protein BV20DRAFT_960786 [Pilatotrama ljubarskyi]